jgi:excisionase family DNA binding protein
MNDNIPLDRLAVTPEEAARLLGISRSSIFNMTKSGELKSRMVAGRRLIKYSDLKAVMDGEATPDEIAAAQKRQRKAVAAVAVKRKRSARKPGVLELDEAAA